MDAWLSRTVCKRADCLSVGSGSLPDAAMGVRFPANGRPADYLLLAFRQQPQAGISTVTGGLGLTSAADERFTEVRMV